jgi:hypothetical protein
MPNASFDRDSLWFTARRLDSGIEIKAEFQADKISNPQDGLRYYSVTLLIDPGTRGVSGRDWHLQRGHDISSHGGGKQTLRSIEKQIRDEVLKSPAWDILAPRKSDPNYIVDDIGNIVIPDAPLRRI